MSRVEVAHEAPVPPAPTHPSPRKRPRKSMSGVRFRPGLWVVDALKAGHMPSASAHTVATVIADAADADGRWCFLYLRTIVDRCGGTVSLPTVKRAIDELIRKGLVRRLSSSQKREFFHEGIASKSLWKERLPSVLELMIPASAFPSAELREINRIRASLGEEPLTERSRPRPEVEEERAHREPGAGSRRATDVSPNNPSPNKPGPSVRGSSGTARAPAREAPDGHGVGGGGGEVRREPSGGALELLSRVPDAVLRNPGPDRAALAHAVDRLIKQGLAQEELVALLDGLHAPRRPFAALMRRLRSLEDARAFLDGHLGAGVHRPAERASPPGLGGIPLPRCGENGFDVEGGDMFARPVEFVVDARGTAPRTCSDHPGVRNVPGGTCRVCGRACRSVPGEILHPPAPAATAPAPRTASPLPEPVPDTSAEKAGTDPAVLELMRASLAGPRREDSGRARHAHATECVPTTAGRAAVKAVREQLARLRPREPG
ncbi:hypothetical protein HNR06_004835 [Nocardiopsis arvandica]|uniref:Helix-turn-helix domain-containing protein n=1 Tax=Nocardiopsis sinuspersici TaxID=501010 RepID=A0A7Z0BLG9_9ACTN|nr:hypothetical protein [Nocardiopsis sinuspersici]NYH55246.1 hypothetical protein [Nocardiopsis sinuspersici]